MWIHPQNLEFPDSSKLSESAEVTTSTAPRPILPEDDAEASCKASCASQDLPPPPLLARGHN